MIIGNLHKPMVALDRKPHRNLKIHQPQMDWSMAAGLNAVFVAGAEFGDVCREYPLLLVRAGTDPLGKPQVAPIAARCCPSRSAGRGSRRPRAWRCSTSRASPASSSRP